MKKMTYKFVSTNFNEIESKDKSGKNKPLSEQEKKHLIPFLGDYNTKIEEGKILISFSGERERQDNLEIATIPTLKASSVVGIIRDRSFQTKDDNGDETEVDITLEIGTPFDAPDKPFFLIKMLQSALPDLKFSNNEIPRSMEDIFEFLLVYYYKTVLLKTHMLGFFRTYQRFEQNNDRLRGSIDIARHIRLNAGMNNGKIAYSYRENTSDNYFNHLLIFTYFELKKRFPKPVQYAIENNFNIKSIIEELKLSAPSYQQKNLRKVIEQNRKPIVQPYYQPYEELRQICLRILENMGISISDEDTGSNVEGILFYMPDLWERFVEKFLNHFDKVKNNELSYESQNELEIFQVENNYTRTIRPDFVFYKNNLPVMVLDAKYRARWKDIMREGFKTISKGSYRESYLNDYDKCIRDMNAFNAHITGVIFQCEDESLLKDKQAMVHRISKYNNIDEFYTIPIYIPKVRKDESYESYDRIIENSVRSQVEEIQNNDCFKLWKKET